jgi:twinkle protein
LRTWHHGKPDIDQTEAEHAAADMWIDGHFSFIVPSEDEDSDLMWLLEMAAAAVIRHGADMIVIDPWNELDHAKPREMTLTEYVGWAIRQLKKFAKKYGVHMIVVAHPTKIAKDRDGKVPMPTLYDISDSAAWFNKSDVGIIVHREDGLTKVRVAKAKYHDRIGTPGTVSLVFDKWSCRYQGASA